MLVGYQQATIDMVKWLSIFIYYIVAESYLDLRLQQLFIDSKMLSTSQFDNKDTRYQTYVYECVKVIQIILNKWKLAW